METEAILSSYVADVAERLPRRMRGDVARELRALLSEQLDALAQVAGRGPDADMAAAMLVRFGHPAQVAAGYHPPWSIIDPLDTRTFLLAAVCGVVFLGMVEQTDYLLGWIGALLLFFGLRSWLSHRRGTVPAWRPPRPGRVGNLALAGVCWLAIVAYGAPAWLFGQLSGGLALAPVFDYDPGFAAWRLPWLLGLWAAQSVLLAWTATRSLETPAQRRMQLGFGVATLGLLLWFHEAGPLFVDREMDAGAHLLLRAAAAVMAIDVLVKLYREHLRSGAEGDGAGGMERCAAVRS